MSVVGEKVMRHSLNCSLNSLSSVGLPSGVSPMDHSVVCKEHDFKNIKVLKYVSFYCLLTSILKVSWISILLNMFSLTHYIDGWGYRSYV